MRQAHSAVHCVRTACDGCAHRLCLHAASCGTVWLGGNSLWRKQRTGDANPPPPSPSPPPSSSPPHPRRLTPAGPRLGLGAHQRFAAAAVCRVDRRGWPMATHRRSRRAACPARARRARGRPGTTEHRGGVRVSHTCRLPSLACHRCHTDAPSHQPWCGACAEARRKPQRGPRGGACEGAEIHVSAAAQPPNGKGQPEHLRAVVLAGAANATQGDAREHVRIIMAEDRDACGG